MKKLICVAAVVSCLLSGCGSKGSPVITTTFAGSEAGNAIPTNLLAPADDQYYLLGNTSYSFNGFGTTEGILVNDTIADAATYAKTLGNLVFAADMTQNGYLSNGPTLFAGGDTEYAKGNTDGSFAYLPNRNFRGTDLFRYYLVQYSLLFGAVRISVNPATVKLTVGPVVWFVDNTKSSGNGTQGLPYPTLAEAVAASQDNDIIFIETGDGTSKGLTGTVTLKPGQRLMGQGVGLAVNVAQGDPVVINPTSGPTLSIVGKGTPARLPGPVILANDCVVEGLNFQGTTGTTLVGNGAKNVTVRNNTFGGATGPVLNLDSCTGILSFTGNTVAAQGASSLNSLQVNATSGTSSLDFSGNTFADDNTVDPADLFGLSVSGSASVVAKVDKNTVTSTDSKASYDRFLVVSSQGTSTVTLNADQNSLALQQTGVAVTNGSSGTSSYQFTNNTINSTEDGITVDGGGAGTVNLLCSQNTVTVNETGNPGDMGDGYSCLEVKNTAARVNWEFTQNTLTGGTDGIFSIDLGGVMAGTAQSNVCHQQQFHPVYIRTFVTALDLVKVLSNTLTDGSNDGVVLASNDTSTLNLALRDNQGVVLEATEKTGSSFCLDMTGNTFDRAVLDGGIGVERLDLADGGPLDAVNTFTTSLVTTGPVSVPIGTCGL